MRETAPPENPVILYFGNDWFAENRTSSHHIARWLAKRHRVYYIECPGLRPPTREGRDLRKIWSKLLRFWRGAMTVEPGIRVRTLLQVPLHGHPLVRRANRYLMWLTLKRLIRGEAIDRPVTWFLVPHVASIVGRLGERLSVYYCIDDYSALPGVDAEAVRALDEELTRQADLVFVASETLLDAKRRLNPETRLSPHGVDLAHFGKALDPTLPEPPDMRRMARPIVGFHGLVERWIDLELVAYLASQRPAWSFVLIGRVALPESDVPRLPNLHYLGKRDYDQLPAYGRLFDAAIIPYRLTQQVLHANPMKLREYLAMGRPVVSVSTPEIDKYSDVVDIAKSPQDFLAMLDGVILRGTVPTDAAKRIARVSSEGWDARLDRVMEVVNGRLVEAASRLS